MKKNDFNDLVLLYNEIIFDKSTLNKDIHEGTIYLKSQELCDLILEFLKDNYKYQVFIDYCDEKNISIGKTIPIGIAHPKIALGILFPTKDEKERCLKNGIKKIFKNKSYYIIENKYFGKF